MAKAPAFQFYAQDFLTGVMYLTNEEIGIYIKMLAKQWTDGKIPKKRLGFLVGLDWDKLSDELKSKFTDFGEYILNERLEKEREKKQKYIKKQSENGKKGGRPRKKDKSKPTENSDNKTQNKPKPFKNKNPNKNQKKPLEDEVEEEIEIEIENEKEGMGEKTKNKVSYPFDTEDFKTKWQHWKIYKRKEFDFNYKSNESEQAALTELANKSNRNEKTAIAIIHQSMAAGWKGLFELKQSENEKNNKKTVQYSDDFKRSILEKLQSK